MKSRVLKLIGDSSQLIADYGNPYHLSSNDQISSLNEEFWAGLYDYDNIVLVERKQEKSLIIV